MKMDSKSLIYITASEYLIFNKYLDKIYQLGIAVFGKKPKFDTEKLERIK